MSGIFYSARFLLLLVIVAMLLFLYISPLCFVGSAVYELVSLLVSLMFVGQVVFLIISSVALLHFTPFCALS